MVGDPRDFAGVQLERNDRVPVAEEAFTPLRRLIVPEDVANTVAFLASDRARNITGQVINVTAGAHLPPMT